jgi:DNA recombination protein RmuC
MLIEILLAVVVILLIVLIILVIKGKRFEPRDIESAISNVWIKLGLDEKVGRLETYASDIRDSYKSLEQMLRVPKERASFGELGLETILSDQLPPDMFGIRKMILDGKKPDAYIRSTAGLICIDSKFPLDNYKKMVETRQMEERDDLKRRFLKDVQGHLNKISNDYVIPARGSAEFAFAYIPSEAVYYFLVNDAYDMLRDFAKKGVQVVSPLTLSHKIELIKAGLHAKRLSEEAERVKNDLLRLSQRFKEVDEKWRAFHEIHLKNAEKKARELDDAYKKLRDEFDSISKGF